jgi:hypothetical protein
MSANPYMPPRAFVADVSGADSEAEAIRQEHIKHEASVRSIGTLYYVGAVLMLVGSVALIGSSLYMSDTATAFGVGFGAVYIVLGALSLFVGRGIRKLKSWARTTCIVLSFIGLLGFPVGTIINGYILYLLLSEKGKRIFAPDYEEIVAATPHVKYRTSVVVWVVVGILLLGIAAAIIVPLATR